MTLERQMMKEGKSCGRRELNALFTRLATLIEDHSENGDDYLVDQLVEPIIERFVEVYYCDVEPVHIMNYLLVWFMQWRTSQGLWTRDRQPFPPADALAVSEDCVTLGYVIERDDGLFLAVDVIGRPLGNFKTQAAAVHVIKTDPSIKHLARDMAHRKPRPTA